MLLAGSAFLFTMLPSALSDIAEKEVTVACLTV